MVTLTANKPSELCLEMRKKGYASRIILQKRLFILSNFGEILIANWSLKLNNLSYWSKLVTMR